MTEVLIGVQDEALCEHVLREISPWMRQQERDGRPDVMKDFSFFFQLSSETLGRLRLACSRGKYELLVVGNRLGDSCIRLVYMYAQK